MQLKEVRFLFFQTVRNKEDEVNKLNQKLVSSVPSPPLFSPSLAGGASVEDLIDDAMFDLDD